MEKKPTKKAKPPTNHNQQQVRTTPVAGRGPGRPPNVARTPAQKRSLTPSTSSGSVDNSTAKRRRIEEEAAVAVSPIVFADTRVPKPSRTPLVRTRHSWNPEEAPPSRYGVKDEEETDSPSTSRKLRPRTGGMKTARVTLSPLPIGKIMCMKLLQDRRKTFEILSMSSPRKLLNAGPSTDPPRSSAVNRSLLSQYEKTSQQHDSVRKTIPQLRYYMVVPPQKHSPLTMHMPIEMGE